MFIDLNGGIVHQKQWKSENNGRWLNMIVGVQMGGAIGGWRIC